MGGGFLEVLPDRVTVLADVAEHAEEISIEQAEAARKRAQERLAGTLSTRGGGRVQPGAGDGGGAPAAGACTPRVKTSDLVLKITGGAPLAGGSVRQRFQERGPARDGGRPADRGAGAPEERAARHRHAGDGARSSRASARRAGRGRDHDRRRAARRRPRVPDDLGKRMRATILLLGALIGRFGSARLPRPGGDDIGARRVEQHLRGPAPDGRHDHRVGHRARSPRPSACAARASSSTCPRSRAPRTSCWRPCAPRAGPRSSTPRASRTSRTSASCSARWAPASRASALSGWSSTACPSWAAPSTRWSPDYLEAGTYAIAAVAAGGELRLECSRPEDLNIVLLKLEQAGARVEVGEGWFRVGRRQGSTILPTDMSTWPFPGFPDRPPGAVHGADDAGRRRDRHLRVRAREPLPARDPAGQDGREHHRRGPPARVRARSVPAARARSWRCRTSARARRW